ncbi:MAG: restriction endonuclease subunit S [Chitinophagales bacterium]|nr:restriction endonuclease subunit S [Chitinophagales bacterium]
MTWSKVKMGEFLINRESRFKPKDKAIAGLKRIDKIDFSGTIYLSDKPSNTDMIIVKKGDLVISGINVEKGAMSVYQGKEDVTATIHYSSYSFDEKKIDIEFLKMFLKSPEFKAALKEQVPGGIKTEIKPKHLLPLEVNIPTQISDQKEIVKRFTGIGKLSSSVDTEIINQQDLLTQLRQSFLREAMQGKLVKQDPKDGHAKDLLEKIKAEKAKSGKKEKELPRIKPEEIPFEIPENWVWCRLSEVGRITGGGTPSMSNPEFWNGNIPWVSPKDMGVEFILDTEMKVTKKGVEESTTNLIPTGSLLIVGRSGILKRKLPVAINRVECTVNQDMKVIIPYITLMNRFLQFMFNGMEHIILKNYVKFGMTVHSLRYAEFALMPIPLPPLKEQAKIVGKLEELMILCGSLQKSIQASREQNELLLQQVLKEALNQ